MSEQKISFWKKLFGKKGMPMEEPDASADLNEEIGQTAVAEAVKERKIRQKLQLPANMQSETAENVPDSFYEQMTKECQKLVEYGVSSYHYSEAERRYLTALSAYRGQDCFELPEAVALPQVVDGKTIEAVESLAKTWGMKSVVIPKTVKEIEIGFIDGVEKICFEPGSCFRRFTPTGWSARGVLALEEVNFPTDADLLPLILLPGAKKIPYFVNIAFDEDGFKRCGECILDCNYAPEVYDSKEDTAVWLQWTDGAHRIARLRAYYFNGGDFRDVVADRQHGVPQRREATTEKYRRFNSETDGRKAANDYCSAHLVGIDGITNGLSAALRAIIKRGNRKW